MVLAGEFWLERWSPVFLLLCQLGGSSTGITGNTMAPKSIHS